MATPLVDEPLVESAPLAHRLAGQYCRKDPATGEDCAWYHGFWQYMRVMNVAKVSGGHVGFLVDALRALAGSGDFPRVLVSGSADYSMPAHVVWAYGGAALDLSVVDRCETPLALTRWYAARRGRPVTTHVSDILDFERAQPFDVVTTNSFLGFFDLPGRARLFASWARLLRPGGKLMLTNRIRPGAGYEPVGFAAAEARVFCDTVRREAERLRDVFGFDPDDVVQWAAIYAERRRPIPVRSEDEVLDLLRSNGFAIDRLDTAMAGGRTEGGAVSGPTTAERAGYVRVVATRE